MDLFTFDYPPLLFALLQFYVLPTYVLDDVNAHSSCVLKLFLNYNFLVTGSISGFSSRRHSQYETLLKVSAPFSLHPLPLLGSYASFRRRFDANVPVMLLAKNWKLVFLASHLAHSRVLTNAARRALHGWQYGVRWCINRWFLRR